MKKKLGLYYSIIVLFNILVYWCSGLKFERGPELGGLIITCGLGAPIAALIFYFVFNTTE